MNDNLNDLSLILTDMQVFALELQKQGFYVETDEDAAGRVWVMVFCGDTFVTTITPDTRRWDLREASLRRCREAGFVWPP